MTTPHEIAEAVERRLKLHQSGAFDIRVMEDLIRQEDGWWYVPIRPDREDRKTFEYYEVLADVEGELEETEKLNVLLVPTASGP
jgi:hypothetical protein